MPRAVFIGVNMVPSGSSFKPSSEVSCPSSHVLLSQDSFLESLMFSEVKSIVILTPRVTGSKDHGRREDVSDKRSVLSTTFFLGHLLVRFNAFVTIKTSGY